MKTLRLLAAAIAIAAATSASAQAAPGTGLNYMQVRTGMYLPQSDDLDTLELNSGFGFDLVFGRRFSPVAAGELGLGWVHSGGDELDLFGDGLTTLESDLSLLPIIASLRLIAPVGSVEPYLLVGVGLVRAALGASVRDPEFGSLSADSTATAFGMQLGAGAAFPLSANTSLGLDVRYLTAEPEFDEGGEELKLDVSGLLVNAALSYRF